MSHHCTNISLTDLKQKLFRHDKMVILDVRQIEEYRSGNIQGSILIPLDILPHQLDTLDKDKEIVCVCHSGSRSQQACDILSKHGFRNVKSLSGGLSSWVA